MLSVFILVTGEWVQPMQGAADVVGPAIAGFYIPIVLIGKFLLMNLLVAVILTEFEDLSKQAWMPRAAGFGDRFNALLGGSGQLGVFPIGVAPL